MTEAPKDTSTFNFEHRRKTLIEYMKVKMDEADWHGVSDAANDLREIEAEERVRQLANQSEQRIFIAQGSSFPVRNSTGGGG